MATGGVEGSGWSSFTRHRGPAPHCATQIPGARASRGFCYFETIMSFRVATMVLGCALLVGACGSPQEFTGTWERPVGEGFSSLSFDPIDGGYRVRWAKVDGRATVRCDDDGLCEEYFGNDKVCDWKFAARAGEADGELLLEVHGNPVDASTAPVSYVDRLVLEPGGRALEAHPLSTDGAPDDTSRPILRFRKVSDLPL